MRVIFLVATLFFVTVARGETITVAAAISMKEMLVAAGAAYQEQTGEEVLFAFGASGQLLTQIRNGAPIDAFISAAVQQIDALEKEKLAIEGSRRIIAGNQLVLIAPAGTKLGLASIADLKRDDVKKIAVGQPKTVPAGQYAMQTLEHLKLAEELSGKIVNGANVRQVLDYVERGEVDAGFVYQTDAEQSGLKVKVIAAAPPESHDPIVYPAVVVSASKNQAAATKFLDFLTSKKGQAIVKRFGFVVDPPATQPTTKPMAEFSPRSNEGQK